MPDMDWPSVGDETVQRLVELIRLETVNPPGNESLAVDVLARHLRAEGIEPVVLDWKAGRSNLVARLKGDGSLAPLLLMCHTDVVPAEPEHWTHPPFSGTIADGFVWGRGTLDMKHFVAEALVTVSLLKRTGVWLKRDVIFAATADEEQGGGGIQFLVREHPDLIRAEWGINEVGGACVELNGKRIYPVQIAEKGAVWVKVRAKGKPGHASIPHDENAVIRLSQGLARLGRRRLPFHLTAPAAAYLSSLGNAVGGLPGAMIKAMRWPALSDAVLARMTDPALARTFYAVLHNTATPTGLSAGKKANVIPSAAEAVIDCRVLPGISTECLLAELDQGLGGGFDFELILESPPYEAPRASPLFDTIRSVVQRNDPGSRVVPYMMPAATDAKYVAPLGIKVYGFTPLKMPPGEKFIEQFHSHDERVSVDALHWGTRALFETVRDFAAGG